MGRKVLFAGVLLLMSELSSAQTMYSMNIAINGLRDKVGQVMVFLYNDSEAYPTKREKAFRTKNVPVSSATMVVTLENIPAGTYGVAVYHDENNNGKMDRHWYGPPKEGYGASNDATGTLGPPSFNDAQFTFPQTKDTVKIIIHY